MSTLQRGLSYSKSGSFTQKVEVWCLLWNERSLMLSKWFLISSNKISVGWANNTELWLWQEEFNIKMLSAPHMRADKIVFSSMCIVKISFCTKFKYLLPGERKYDGDKIAGSHSDKNCVCSRFHTRSRRKEMVKNYIQEPQNITRREKRNF